MRAFLLRTALPVCCEPYAGLYSYRDEINFVELVDGVIPVVMYMSLFGTQSKTFAAPGDDDPDREAENCY